MLFLLLNKRRKGDAAEMERKDKAMTRDKGETKKAQIWRGRAKYAGGIYC